jgi:hypothetical protein
MTGSVVRTVIPGAPADDAAEAAVCGVLCAAGEGAEFVAGAGPTEEFEYVAGKLIAGGADSGRALDFTPGSKCK